MTVDSNCSTRWPIPFVWASIDWSLDPSVRQATASANDFPLGFANSSRNKIMRYRFASAVLHCVAALRVHAGL
jgi:hypothetical protein